MYYIYKILNILKKPSSMKKLKNIIQSIQNNDFKYCVYERKILNNSIIELNIKMKKLFLIYSVKFFF